MGSNTRKITLYIRLLNEGVPVLRPTQAELIEERTAKVLPTANYDPNDEEWEFTPGSIVRFAKEEREGEVLRVAKERVTI